MGDTHYNPALEALQLTRRSEAYDLGVRFPKHEQALEELYDTMEMLNTLSKELISVAAGDGHILSEGSQTLLQRLREREIVLLDETIGPELTPALVQELRSGVDGQRTTVDARVRKVFLRFQALIHNMGSIIDISKTTQELNNRLITTMVRNQRVGG